MPVAILKPNGAGSVSQWSVTGAATVWQALADESTATYASTIVAGNRFRVTMEDLPADAMTVTAVTLYSSLGQTGTATCKLALTLSGTDSLSGVLTPPDGASTVLSASYALAPGALSWTAARVAAVEAGVDSLAAASVSMLAESMWLEVTYTTSTPDPPGPTRSMRLPDTTTATPSLGEVASVSMPGTATASVDAVTLNPVDMRLPVHGTHSVTFTPEG